MLMDSQEVAPGVTKVNLRGRLDAAGAIAVEPAFQAMARTQYDMVVDLSRVSFLASRGLRVLIDGARFLAAHGGRMAFFRPDITVQAVLINSGADSVIPIHSDLTAAIRGMCHYGKESGEALQVSAESFTHTAARSDLGAASVGMWVDDVAHRLDLSERSEYALRLCLEEAVTNIVRHAKAFGADERIVIRLVAGEDLRIAIEDRSDPFNPLDLDHPDVPERELLRSGGLGIGLMRQFARETAWSRLGGTNRLTMRISR